MRSFFRIYDNLEEVVMIALLTGMVVIMIVQIFFRYALGLSLSWSEEITRYLFVWSAFMSVSFCTKHAISIRIDQLIRMFSRRGRAMVKIFNLTVECAFFVYMIPFAYRYLLSTVESGQVSPACGIPMYWVQAAPLVCFSLCVVRIVERWFLQWSNFLHDTEYHSWKELRAAEALTGKEVSVCRP